MSNTTEVPEPATSEGDASSAEVNMATEENLLADILSQSPFLKDDRYNEESLPEETDEYNVESDDDESEDPMDESESEEIDDEEEVDEVSEDDTEDEDADDESATQDSMVLSEEEVDWDVVVPVTIDGETVEVSLQELRKGYATEQHLSKKGRELGDERKLIEEERTAKLGEIESYAGAVSQLLLTAEQNLANEYHAVDQEIKQAREDGDTYKISELRDKREEAQEKYWNARRQREGLIEGYSKQKQQVEVENWNKQVSNFNESIGDFIPGYNEKYAIELTEFGLSKGLTSEYMQTITDPAVVKILDEYRKLEQGVSKGAKKRAKAPVKKAPVKKQQASSKKKQDADKMVKARAFREDASKEDQMAFLRNHAARSLSLKR